MNFFYSVLTGITDGDVKQKISAKRVISFIITLTIVIISFGHVFYGKTVSEFIFTGLVECLIWCMGFVGAEGLTRMAPKIIKNKSNRPQTTEEIIEEQESNTIDI